MWPRSAPSVSIFEATTTLSRVWAEAPEAARGQDETCAQTRPGAAAWRTKRLQHRRTSVAWSARAEFVRLVRVRLSLIHSAQWRDGSRGSQLRRKPDAGTTRRARRVGRLWSAVTLALY